MVGGDRFFKTIGYVSHLVEPVGIFLKSFQRQGIDHRRIVEVEQGHVAKLIDRLIDYVEVGKFLSVRYTNFSTTILEPMGVFFSIALGSSYSSTPRAVPTAERLLS